MPSTGLQKNYSLKVEITVIPDNNQYVYVCIEDDIQQITQPQRLDMLYESITKDFGNALRRAVNKLSLELREQRKQENK